jgi:hypothetical protein
MIVDHPLGFFFYEGICEDPMKEEGSFPFNWVIVGASFITLALVWNAGPRKVRMVPGRVRK